MQVKCSKCGQLIALSDIIILLPDYVTSAPLYTLWYEPTAVSLETGSFDDLETAAKAIESVSWVRFTRP